MVNRTYFAILALITVSFSGTLAFANIPNHADIPDHVNLPDTAEREAAYQPHVVRSNGIVATFVPTMTTFGDPATFVEPSEGSALLIIYSSSSAWGCSGTLISDTKILTAAHCVANSIGIVDAISGTADFGIEKYDIIDFVKHKNYDGRYWKGYDLAIVTIDTPAHESIPRVGIDYVDNDPAGMVVTIHGYGVSGTGDSGATLPFGTHRIGQNTIDAYGEVLYDYIGLKANKDYKQGAVLHSDFDNGVVVIDADTGEEIAPNDGFGLFLGSDYEHLGLGVGNEAMVCSGDSGGSIRNGIGPTDQVIGVNSYTLKVEQDGKKSDIDDIDFNCSFGEFTGYMNVPYHADWINSQLGETTTTDGDNFTCEGKKSNHPKC